MAVGRSAASKIDWSKISSSLGLKGQTAASLLAFKKRNDDARRKLAILSNAPQTVDFASYRSTLKNQTIIDEIEGHVKRFRPVTYDVGRQIRAISAFETEAIKNAEETRDKVGVELQHLEATLKNIEEARPWEELTVDEVCAAAPEIDARTENMVSRGKWMPAGYKEKFGDLSFM